VTIFSGDSVVVSLPGAELLGVNLTGSITDPEEVFANPISTALRSALELLCYHAARHGLPVRCIARPELFTNRIAVAALRRGISKKPQHVCLSDGTTVKYLPGIPTHVFFYCRSSPESLFALKRLSRRAPELMSELKSQVNSCFVLGSEPRSLQPRPVFLAGATRRRREPSTLLPFFLNRDSAEDTVNRIERAAQIDRDAGTGFTKVRYLPLTEAALRDRAFAQFVATLIQRSYFNPSIALIIRLPAAPPGASPLLHGICAILPALRETGVVLPRICPTNILITTDDLDDDHLIFARSSRQIYLHESFEFWRHSFGFYTESRTITVFSCAQSDLAAEFLPADISEVYGPRATRHCRSGNELNDDATMAILSS
jgi:hypothetical protein